MTRDHTRVLIILTLKKHEDGIWIRKLVEALHKTQEAATDESVGIKVQALEEWLGNGWNVSSRVLQGVCGIVNRVSDAASPPLFKACCAILGAAELLQIPVYNGPKSYALCGNKWCHHVLFQRAGLKSPTTVAFWNDSNSPLDNAVSDTNEILDGAKQDGTSLLFKPNAGGFGAGIRHVKVPLQESLPVYEDCMGLLQEYHKPKDNKLYRVWFLGGKVQCAIERCMNEEDGAAFTGACSGSCSIQTELPKAWTVPQEIKDEIEEKLLPLLSDAHCGSVEFLLSGSNRLYFDLNLLSTLPIRVSNTEGAWESIYDPWRELGVHVRKVMNSL